MAQELITGEAVAPGYLALYRSGELARRTEELEAQLGDCDICPHQCGVDRLNGETGFCHSGRLPVVASVCAHHGEEPVISGRRGSGTIFFGNCNMRCVYCQNHQISQDWRGQRSQAVDSQRLAESMLYLQDGLDCHNINLVSPSHFVPQIMRALLTAIPAGLHLPLVYNTASYDSVASLSALEGVVSIYLADLRYASETWGRKYSRVSGYVASSRAAIREMQRQVGYLRVDGEGIAWKGLIIRHLILPNGLAGSRESLSWLVDEISPEITVSVMSQYYPAHRARQTPLISRQISIPEYTEVLEMLDDLGIENGWVQDMDAPKNYLPDFSRREHPFV